MGATTVVANREREQPVVTEDESTDAPSGDGPRWWLRLDLWIGLLVVAACCAFVFVKLEPRLLFRNTTPTGGDTVSHVWWPAYLRDHLLPWRIAGWSPDFYGGFPVGQFYFPVPALLIVALDAILPYNIAFKLITALGPIALPAAAYVFGRGLRTPTPVPAAMAVGATTFLFFNGDPGVTPEAQAIAGNQHIMGGNLASMLAGEFSFTLALAFALFFLGTFAYTLRTGRKAWLPAVLFAMTFMSHFIVAIFTVGAALIVWLANRPRSTFLRAAVIGIVGSLLTFVWVIPLLSTFGYTTNTRYETVTQWTDYLFPKHLWQFNGVLPWEMGATVSVGIVLSVALWKRRASYFALLGMFALGGLMFRFWEDLQATPAWNLRFVPFWYLFMFLITAVAAAEIVRGIGALAVRVDEWRVRPFDDDDPVPEPDADPAPDRAPGGEAAGPRALDAGMLKAVVVSVLTVLLTVGALVDVDDRPNDFLPSWIRWNYSGLEDRAKAAPEYQALVNTFRKLPAGRALWEGNQELNVYGSSLALTLLPYFTDGRIGSMEGVYYEASATTPYHFLTVASLMPAQNTSNPIRGLPYRTNAEFSAGVRRLQVLGVRYLAVHSAEAKQAAASDSRLRLVATSPNVDGVPPDAWNIYRVRDSGLVEPLKFAPVVVPRLRTGTAGECEGPKADAVASATTGELSEWECLAVPWFDDPTAFDRVLTHDGPASWQRAGEQQARNAPKVELPRTRVSRVRSTDDSVSFHVSRTGVPVMVKTSYFPNWEVDGARGPYRATPNYMVVVPTSHDVTLSYGTTTAEWVGRLGTLLGVLGVIGLALWPWWRRRRRVG